MFFFTLKFVIATVLSVLSYSLRWWLPLFCFPFSLFFIPDFQDLEKNPPDLKQITITRFLFYVIGTLFIISQVAIFQINIGSWSGWIVGGFFSWIFSGIMAGVLDPWLRFREIP